MEAVVVNTAGKETGKKVRLNDQIFGIEPNDHAIYLDVKQYLANQRQGTHKSKERAEIARTTKKLKRQKGTGGARAGSMKSPLFVGGGRVFGPRPRDYSFKLNKKLKRLACLSALTYKAKGKSVTILENFNFDKPKTKQYADILKNLQLENKKALVVLPQHDHNIYLSARNLQRNKVVTAGELNTYDVLNAQHLVLVEGSVPALETRFLS
ncbi:MAG: 50S ribosomal protein L4 [Bacteroidota bacterium]|jgi:large subunit ribosomal protein L4|nr:50S ribosomal protein L4 [Bacteroidia bacterium]MBP6009498.1 50S ribosomal protein L4 [Bacteroidia bacterium]MBP7268751.1 50S ribosomal protein L4 [Bacteroidia bacterium]MBP7437279.1 50S ribosomal protein L4 [Bacteroidia bacterium]MBP7771583.1 50S ribosomal protein L4 [Bacteroidia bacterium]